MLVTRKIAAIIALCIGAGAAPVLAQEYGPYGYGGGGGSFGYGFDWDGFYAGVYGGGVPMGDTSYVGGVFTGVNASIEGAVFGIEAQLGGDFADDWTIDALVLGRGGLSLGDALVYGTGGLGLVKGDMGYAFGGGAEYGFTDYMSVRGELLGTGEWGGGPSNLRAAAGLAFHL